MVPGYKNLHDFSLGQTQELQHNLGLWWPAYWRLGNWRIVFPVPRSGQERLAKWLQNELAHARVRDVYITRFEPINHCLVVYHCTSGQNGDLIFNVYDAPINRGSLFDSPIVPRTESFISTKHGITAAAW